MENKKFVLVVEGSGKHLDIVADLALTAIPRARILYRAASFLAFREKELELMDSGRVDPSTFLNRDEIEKSNKIEGDIKVIFDEENAKASIYKKGETSCEVVELLEGSEDYPEDPFYPLDTCVQKIVDIIDQLGPK